MSRVLAEERRALAERHAALAAAFAPAESEGSLMSLKEAWIATLAIHARQLIEQVHAISTHLHPSPPISTHLHPSPPIPPTNTFSHLISPLLPHSPAIDARNGRNGSSCIVWRGGRVRRSIATRPASRRHRYAPGQSPHISTQSPHISTLPRPSLVTFSHLRAAGKELTPDDFHIYMRHHARKLFHPSYAPKPFCFAVRPHSSPPPLPPAF